MEMKKVDLHRAHSRAALVVIISIMGEEKRALLQKSQPSTLHRVYKGEGNYQNSWTDVFVCLNLNAQYGMILRFGIPYNPYLV